MPARSLARALALAATVLAAAWAAVLIVAGGFELDVGPWRLSSHQPMRPMVWGTLPLAVFIWANGVRRTADTWTRVIDRLNHTLVAGGLALVALGVGVTYSTTVANASDAYGYVSQADLWRSGTLTVSQPWAADAPWPRAAWTFAPLGYRPVAELGPDLVPVYSPGLPLLMAAAKAMGGQSGLFLVVPVSGAVLVLTTWGIGRRLGASGGGLVAAWLVLASPVFLYMLALPMTDVPVAACWSLAAYFALGRTKGDAAAAGLATAIAILVRPNLIWLAAMPAGWILRAGATPRLAIFAAPTAVAVVALGWFFNRLYGSPLQSGYGELGAFFSWTHVGTNVVRYARWLIETQTPLALAGLAGLALPAAGVWSGIRDRRFVPVMGASVATLWAFYSFYLPFDAWWFLRFLLPSWPFMLLGLAVVLLAMARRYGAFGRLAAAWLVVVLGAYTFDVGRARGTFDLWHADRAYVAAAHAVRSLTPDSSVVFSDLHSGSLRYYGGRVTLRFTLLDPAWLDRAVAWMAERGVASYVLLERDEVEAFRTQFASQSVAGRLEGAPLLMNGESGLVLHALSGSAADATRFMQVDEARLRAVPPVPLPPLRFH